MRLTSRHAWAIAAAVTVWLMLAFTVGALGRIANMASSEPVTHSVLVGICDGEIIVSDGEEDEYPQTCERIERHTY